MRGLSAVEADVADMIAFDLLRRAYFQLAEMLLQADAAATLEAMASVETLISALVESHAVEPATQSVGREILVTANRKVQAILRERPAPDLPARFPRQIQGTC
ncbi:hypothetical protein [Methylobacterium nigriterrae]|uniref:hypothetical protein n=1 Tax=Methylobacterium nigriterrae TaxID=3127512 RepID=UPI0030134D43